jgi:thioester reductase-like protein
MSMPESPDDSHRQTKHVFLTGATGFLGSHLAHTLLADGCAVTALARGSKSASAQDRVLNVLRQAAAAAPGVTDDKSFGAERLRVVEGDISRPHLGLDLSELQRIAETTDEVWHCAASLSFEHEDRDEIFQMNVGGTENILDLVKRTRTRRLQHVSTAYVAGNREFALESELDVGQTFRNAYEESKCQSEKMVSAAHRSGDIVASIYRPSVVIGDSRTGRATHFHGVYAFIRGLHGALLRLRRKQGSSGNVHLPLRVAGSEHGTLNFVPIDYVVQAMLHIAKSADAPGGTFHLANPMATANHIWLPTICRLLRVEGIRFVDAQSFQEEPPTKLEALFQKQMAFYYMYLKGEPRFDCSETLRALRGTGIECPQVTVAFIEKMVGWYVKFLSGEIQ